LLLKEPILRNVENHKYQIKIADKEEEVDSALMLRFHVFGRELHRDFQFKNGRDYDEYDDQCHHLIVVEKATGNVVGTYRLQTCEQARDGEGFYTAKRFHLNQLPNHVLKNSFEVGRACIENDHRNGRVLFLLWKGLAGYLQYFKKRYMFGYSALDTSEKHVALNTYSYLKENDYLHPDYVVDVKEKYKCEAGPFGRNGEIDMPGLFKNYLQVGTKVCSKPAYDSNLALIHFFILLDIETISERTHRMFFG
jgi:putative hemolysin